MVRGMMLENEGVCGIGVDQFSVWFVGNDVDFSAVFSFGFSDEFSELGDGFGRDR